MRQISLVTIATVLALSLSGCFGQNSTTNTETSPESSAESPVVESPVTASPPTESNAGATDGTESATTPDATPPQSNVATLPRDLDLIPSTNPDQRVQSVQGERSDPFSVVPTTPSVQIEILDDGSSTQTDTTGGNGQPARGTANGGSAGAGAAGRSAGSGSAGGRTAASGGGLAPIPNLVPGRSTATPTVAPQPRPPQPTLARAVEVLGVVQIGSVPYAIVSAPNEPTSRYVREGQRLSNGQIVVRRIEMNGPAPAVVFEQYGIEVITAVGEGGAPETTEAAPAAALPSGNEQQAG